MQISEFPLVESVLRSISGLRVDEGWGQVWEGCQKYDAIPYVAHSGV